MEVFNRWTDKARVYGCATHRRKGPSICGNAAAIEKGTADAAVLAVVEQTLDPELLAAALDRTAEKLAGQAYRREQFETQLADVEAQMRRGTPRSSRAAVRLGTLWKRYAGWRRSGSGSLES